MKNINCNKDYIKKDNLNSEIISNLNLKIYQDDRFFKYGVDSVELCKFIKKCESKDFNKNIELDEKKINKKKLKIVDICSGSGIIGLIIQRIFKLDEIDFIEKQKYFAKINEINCIENLKDIKFNVYNIDIKDVEDENNNLNKNSFDIIATNPPYKDFNSGIKSKNIEKTIAKMESENFLENLFKSSNYLLKDKGKLYMVNRIDRIVDIFEMARKYKLEPKIIQFIVNNKSQPKMILIQFIKNSKKFLKVLDNRLINN